MSYYRELKDMVLELRGGFFLSPREVWFLNFLEREGYPLEVVREGIRKFFLFYPPEKRSKLPLFMSFGEIQKLKRRYLKRQKEAEGWKERFRQKLKRAESLLGESLSEPEVKSVKEAEEFLMALEGRIARLLWERLTKEERTELLKKFRVFKDNEELLKSLVKRELLQRAGLKSLSLFVD